MTKYTFKTKPYKHQVKALKVLLANRGGGLFMEMGTGKSKVAIDFIGAAHMKWGVNKALIVCGKSYLGVWNSEIPKHMPDEIRDQVEIRLINYDKVWRDLDLAEWVSDGVTAIVCDESHKIKNAQARRSKAMHALARRSGFRVALSGTPIAKGPLDLFSQFKFIDEGIYGSSWTQFKKRYSRWGGYGGFTLIRYVKLKELYDKIKDVIYQVKKVDCLDLPKYTHEIVPVRLGKEARSIYNTMAQESIVQISEGEVATAPIVLSRLLRLSQITGGWLRLESGEYTRVGMDKYNALDGLLGEFVEQENTRQGEVHKVVVFCRFLRELKDVVELGKKHGYTVLPLHGKVSTAQREQRIAAFDEAHKRLLFVAQIDTGAEGISLVAASEAVFYSHNYNYAQFDQACARLHRIGQKRAVTYYHFIARDSVDEAVWLALRSKRDLAKLVLSDPSLIT